MGEPFIGSDAVTSGRLTPYALGSKYVAIQPNVYVAREAQVTAVTRAKAAWLWSRRHGVVAGHSASALHGAKWVDHRAAAELLYDNRHPPRGIRTWADRLHDDEIDVVGGIGVTTPARTAFDIACRYRMHKAVAAIDALARDEPQNGRRRAARPAVQGTTRYQPCPSHIGTRGSRRRVTSPDVAPPAFDSGRLSARHKPRFRSTTNTAQIVAFLDMGWEHIRVAVEYEADHPRIDRLQFNKDIARLEALTDLGWIIVRVTIEDTAGALSLGYQRRGAAERETVPKIREGSRDGFTLGAVELSA